MNEQQEQAVEFFHEHAGWGYDPTKETPEQGRRKGAELLAKAEQWARSENITFGWEDDWSVGSHVDEFESYEQEPGTCETATAYGPAGEVLASLGCIDDADTNYRRVIAAELALEAMTAEPTKPEQPTAEQGYNGWTNYETWSVALIIDNDQGLQERAQEIARQSFPLDVEQAKIWSKEERQRYLAADALKDWIETEAEVVTGNVTDYRPLSYLWSQLMSAAISEVDWNEVADHYLEETS